MNIYMDPEPLQPLSDQNLNAIPSSTNPQSRVSLVLLVLIVLLSVAVLFLLYENNKLRSRSISQKLTTAPSVQPTTYPKPETETVPIVELPMPTDSETWRVYRDQKTGMQLKYPPTVTITSSNDSENLKLQVFSETYTEIKDAEESTNNTNIHTTLGYDSKTYLQDYESLQNGEYGADIACGLKQSKRVLKIGNLYMKAFDVLACITAEDVQLDRIAVFYPDKDHRIIVSLSAPIEKVIAENPEYFSGEYNWWKNAANPSEGYGLDKFYEDVINGNTGPITRNWHIVFDQILGSVTLK